MSLGVPKLVTRKFKFYEMTCYKNQPCNRTKGMEMVLIRCPFITDDETVALV